MLHTEDVFFLSSESYIDRYDLALLKLAADAGIGYIIFEATHIIGRHILLCVFAVAGDGDGVQHTH